MVGGDDEVQAGRAGPGRDLLGQAPSVGVHGVQVAVAPVPGPAAAAGPLRRVARGELRPGRAEPEGDLDAVLQALRGDLVRAQDDVPGAGVDRPGEVAGGRGVAGEAELGAEAAGPAAEAGAAEVGAALVEDADVAGVSGGPGRDRGLVVAVGDGDLADALGDFDREVDEVGCAGGEMAGEGEDAVARARRGGGLAGGGGQAQDGAGAGGQAGAEQVAAGGVRGLAGVGGVRGAGGLGGVGGVGLGRHRGLRVAAGGSFACLPRRVNRG